MKLLENGEITIEIFQEQSWRIDQDVLMISLSAHFVFEGKSAILVLYSTVATILVDIL
jgi:hypothetical protein